MTRQGAYIFSVVTGIITYFFFVVSNKQIEDFVATREALYSILTKVFPAIAIVLGFIIAIFLDIKKTYWQRYYEATAYTAFGLYSLAFIIVFCSTVFE